MKMYMGFNSFYGKNEAACLVFANTAKEAKKIAFPVIENWFGGGWLEVKIKMLRDSEYLKSLSTSALPHVIEFPETCPKCELWGTGEIVNGSCSNCKECKT